MLLIQVERQEEWMMMINTFETQYWQDRILCLFTSEQTAWPSTSDTYWVSLNGKLFTILLFLHVLLPSSPPPLATNLKPNTAAAAHRRCLPKTNSTEEFDCKALRCHYSKLTSVRRRRCSRHHLVEQHKHEFIQKTIKTCFPLGARPPPLPLCTIRVVLPLFPHHVQCKTLSIVLFLPTLALMDLFVIYLIEK